LKTGSPSEIPSARPRPSGSSPKGGGWPLEQGYSYGGDRCKEIFLEPRVGGRFFERFLNPYVSIMRVS